ncbi:MAG: polyprenyl synthetase family protein [Pseudohongiellaceae bacterium]
MVQDIRAAVAADFEAVNRYIVEQLHSRVPLVESIGQYIIDAGGKRLRPVLVLLGARCCGHEGDQAVRMAAVIEFIHTATLLHDDVVDMSTMRRGRPTANEQWSNPSSVLVGDFIYSRAFQILVGVENPKIMRIIADTTNTIAEGEVLQLLNKHRVDTSEADYMQVIEDKTAILFQTAAQCGAIVAEAPEAEEDALKRAGRHIGLAFQLIDDLLDYSGESQALGKNIGDDLAEGKPTLPLIHAMHNSSADESSLLRSAIEHGGTEHLNEIIRIVRQSGSLDYTRQLAGQEVDRALEALSTLPDNRFRQAMERMARLAVSRDQ